MTTSGFSIDRIDVLRDARCYVTALMFDTVDEDTRPALAVLHNRYAGQAYGWGSVITRGWNILFARDLPKFRFKFLIDFAVVFLALDAVTRPITHTIVFSWLLVPILLLVGYNAQRFMTGDHAFDQMSPESFWEALRKYGARAIINVGDIRGKRPQAIITSDLYAFFDSRSSPSASEVARAFRQLGVAVVGDPPSGHSHHETVEVALTDSSNGQCQVWSEPADEVRKRLVQEGISEWNSCLCVKSDLEPANLAAAVSAACALAIAHHGVFFNPGFGVAIPAAELVGPAEAMILDLVRMKQEREAKRRQLIEQQDKNRSAAPVSNRDITKGEERVI